jgi:hypothetical protein
MRFRTLALALALSCGVAGVVQAAAKKPPVYRVKRQKIQKTKKYKQSKASKVKPRKVKKVKIVKRAHK